MNFFWFISGFGLRPQHSVEDGEWREEKTKEAFRACAQNASTAGVRSFAGGSAEHRAVLAFFSVVASSQISPLSASASECGCKDSENYFNF